MSLTSMNKILRQEDGFALLLALFVVAAVLIMGITIMSVSMMNMESSNQISMAQQSFQVADGGTSAGLNYLDGWATPPESDMTEVAKPPLSRYTAWSSGMNPIDTDTGEFFPYPQFRYRVQTMGEPVSVDQGQDMSIPEGYNPSNMKWHYYRVTAQARSGQAANLDRVDRTVKTVVRLMFLH